MPTYKKCRRIYKRSHVSFKVSRKFTTAKLHAADKSQLSLALNEKQNLQQQNATLAFTLNTCKEENANLKDHINHFDGKILDLRTKLSEMKSKYNKQKMMSEKFDENEFSKRLAEYLEPQQICLKQGLEHVIGLTQNLETAMKLAKLAGCRSNSNSSRPLLQQTHQPLQTTPNRQHRSVAQVIPMVKGYNISRPKIFVPRLNMNDLTNLGLFIHTEDNADAEDEPGTEEEEQTENEQQEEMVESDVDIALEAEQEEEYVAEERVTTRRVRPQREIQSPILGAILEDNEAEEDSEDGQTVILLPRLVLERLSLSPQPNFASPERRKSRKSAGRRNSERRSTIYNLKGLSAFRKSLSSPKKSEAPSKSEALSNPEPEAASRSAWTSSPNRDALPVTRRTKRSVEVNGSSISPIRSAAKGSRESSGTKELKIVVTDFGKSSTLDVSITHFEHDKENESPHEIESQESKKTPRKKRNSSIPVSNSATQNESQTSNEFKSPNGSINESMEEFFLRMYNMDPLEGPSWLLDNRGRKRTHKPRQKSSKTEAKDLKEVAVCDSTTEQDPADPLPSTSQTTEMTSQPNEQTLENSTNPADKEPHETSLPNNSNNNDDVGRGSRRRAASSITSFKEPSLRKKMRNSDSVKVAKKKSIETKATTKKK